MANTNFIMYVITHKDAKKPDVKSYKSLFVGAENNRNNGFDYYDNIGENISKKNPHYCELTGIYWIWKNTETRIIGICHYRRFFSYGYFKGKKGKYLDEKGTNKILKNYKVILPIQKCYSDTMLLSANIAPNFQDLEEMYSALKKCYPDYIPDYLWYLGQNKTYLYNMCVMKRSDFEEYCEWIFSILNYIEKKHDLEKENKYRQRLFGFLSERLIAVWIHHKYNDNEIKTLPVINSEESDLNRFRQYLGNIRRNFLFAIKKKSKKYKRVQEAKTNRIEQTDY